VGYGKASKEQMMEMVRVLLRLREIPKPDHAADALGVAICHANSSVIRAKLDGIQTGETSRGRAG
jgi:crossover junction endodeoxyribonuclease RuvC